MYVRQLMAELRPDKLGASVDVFTDNTAAVDIPTVFYLLRLATTGELHTVAG